MLTKAMLRPDFIEPIDHASPVGRDPFMVAWDMYSEGASRSDRTDSSTDVETVSPVGTRPDAKLMAVLTTGNGQNVALIDGNTYEVGSYLKKGSLETVWRVKQIRSNQVVLEYNGTTYVLTIAGSSAFLPEAAGIQSDDRSEEAGAL
jgi:hypothetical protein